MSVGDESLRRLYERLIRQQLYPGRTCPAEHIMIAYESGVLPKEQRRLMDEHLSSCPPCREDFIDLGRAGQWFRENESLVLMGLAAKGAAAGVQPWASCFSAQLLHRYVNDQIPETAGGRILLAQMRAHLSRCPECIRMSEQLRAAAEAPRLSMLDLGSRIGYAIRDRLSGFIDALVATAEACGTSALVRGAPGYRAGEVPHIAAPVLDEKGKLMVDEEGSARQCHFEIIQAGIQDDGFLTLDLAASDREYHSKAGAEYEAAASIVAGGVLLELPATLIDEQGRVTFTGVIPEVKAVDPLPVTAIDVAVTRQPARG